MRRHSQFEQTSALSKRVLAAPAPATSRQTSVGINARTRYLISGGRAAAIIANGDALYGKDIGLLGRNVRFVLARPLSRENRIAVSRLTVGAYRSFPVVRIFAREKIMDRVSGLSPFSSPSNTPSGYVSTFGQKRTFCTFNERFLKKAKVSNESFMDACICLYAKIRVSLNIKLEVRLIVRDDVFINNYNYHIAFLFAVTHVARYLSSTDLSLVATSKAVLNFSDKERIMKREN